MVRYMHREEREREKENPCSETETTILGSANLSVIRLSSHLKPLYAVHTASMPPAAHMIFLVYYLSLGLCLSSLLEPIRREISSLQTPLFQRQALLMHGPISVTAKAHGSEHRFPTTTERKHTSHSPICEPVRLTFGWARCDLGPGSFPSRSCAAATRTGGPMARSGSGKVGSRRSAGSYCQEPTRWEREIPITDIWSY